MSKSGSDSSGISLPGNILTEGDLPSWLDSPQSWFRRQATRYILGLIAGFVLMVRTTISDMWRIVVSAVEDASGAFIAAFTSAGAPFFTVLNTFQSVIAETADSLGPFGPVFLAAVSVVVVVVVVRLLRSLAASVPVLSGVMEFFES